MDSTTTPDVEGPVPLEDVRREIRGTLTAWTGAGIYVQEAKALRDLAEAYVRLGGDLELEQPAIRAELDAALKQRAEVILAAGKVIAAAEELGGDTFEGRLEELGAHIEVLGILLEGLR